MQYLYLRCDLHFQLCSCPHSPSSVPLQLLWLWQRHLRPWSVWYTAEAAVHLDRSLDLLLGSHLWLSSQLIRALASWKTGFLRFALQLLKLLPLWTPFTLVAELPESSGEVLDSSKLDKGNGRKWRNLCWKHNNECFKSSLKLGADIRPGEGWHGAVHPEGRVTSWDLAQGEDQWAHCSTHLGDIWCCLPETTAEKSQPDDRRSKGRGRPHHHPWRTVGQNQPRARKYEVVERALFKCTQRTDETNDSYLARSDCVWSELLAKKIQLEELQAYILLRGSLLSAEDRKRVVVESEAEKAGALTVQKVTQSIRMLGATFFQEMTGQKKVKGKVYEPTALTEHMDDDMEGAYHSYADDIGEDEYILQLAKEDDEDAALVADYETALTDTIQSDEDLASAYNAYSEARKRLSDRYKNRGFWPIGQKGRGKGFQKGGKGKGYGKGPRKSHQQRMLESRCRICDEYGHWKAECPKRHSKTQANSSSTSATTAATATVAAEIHDSEPNILPMEFMQLPTMTETSVDESRMHSTHVVCIVEGTVWDRIRQRGFQGVERNPKPAPMPRSEVSSHEPGKARHRYIDLANHEVAFFSSHGACGILDTGATKSVAGSNLIASLIESLSPSVRRQVFRTTCNITFRFGNQGTLDSSQALVIPLKSIGLGLKIAVVPGNTPLLLSNTLIRTLNWRLASIARNQFWPVPCWRTKFN